MDMGQVSALKLYQSMGGKLSEHTLKAMKNAEAGNLSPTPATRLESAGTIELTAIYADPAIQGSAHRFEGSAAQGAVNALKSIRD